MMVRLNKNDLQAIALWGCAYRDRVEEVGVPFVKEELAVLIKVGRARDKAWGYNRGLFEENQLRE